MIIIQEALDELDRQIAEKRAAASPEVNAEVDEQKELFKDVYNAFVRLNPRGRMAALIALSAASEMLDSAGQ